MSLSATCRAKCNCCGKVIEREVVLDEWTAQGITKHSDSECGCSSRTYANDLWSYLFFCDGECYKAWLRVQGRHAEVKAFEKAVWIA